MVPRDCFRKGHLLINAIEEPGYLRDDGTETSIRCCHLVRAVATTTTPISLKLEQNRKQESAQILEKECQSFGLNLCYLSINRHKIIKAAQKPHWNNNCIYSGGVYPCLVATLGSGFLSQYACQVCTCTIYFQYLQNEAICVSKLPKVKVMATI